MKISKKTILKQIAESLDKRSIQHIGNSTYRFLSSLSSFIAHYNIAGFKEYYRDFDKFLRDLKNSFEIKNPEYYLRQDFLKNDKEYYTEKYEVLKNIKEMII